MKLNEIRQLPQQYEFEGVELQDPENPSAWQPNTEEEIIPHDIRLTYLWYPAERGSRERGSGIQLEPDYRSSVDIIKLEVFDRTSKQWIERSLNYLSSRQLDMFADQLADL